MSFISFPSRFTNDQSREINPVQLNLGTFKIGAYLLKLRFDPINSFSPSLSFNNQTLENVKLVAPFSHLHNISIQKLSKLSSHLLTQYSVNISKVENQEFRIQFIQKLLGGGPISSKPANEEKDERDKKKNVSNKKSSSSATVNTNKKQDGSSSSKAQSISIANIKTTDELARALKKPHEGSEEHKNLEELAFAIIREFTNSISKTSEEFKELTSLTKSGNKKISEAILTHLFELLKNDSLIEEKILVALSDAIRGISSTDLTPHQFLKILNALKETHIHFDSRTNDHNICVLLRAYSCVLDAMGDANVNGVNYDFHDNLFAKIDKLTKHSNWRVSAEASYTKEALKRVGHDRTKLALYVDRSLSFAKGIGNLVQIIEKKLSGQAMLDAYKNFKNAFHNQGEKQFWYDKFRMVSTLLDCDYHAELKSVLKTLDIPKEQEIIFFENLINLLIENVSNHRNNDTFQILKELYLRDSKWISLFKCLEEPKADPQNNVAAQIKIHILTYFKIWKNLSPNFENRFIIDNSKELLDENTTSQISVYQNEWLKQAPEEEKVQINPPSFSQESSLLSRAQKQLKSAADIEQIKSDVGQIKNIIQHKSVKTRFLEMKKKFIEDKELKKLLDTYVNPSGSGDRYYTSPFPLDEKIKNFLDPKNEQKLCLIRGDAGSGKTSYGWYLTNQLWKEWDENKPVPLFIPLQSFTNQSKDNIIEKSLSRFFPQDEIIDLKGHKFVFILDSYDEMGSESNIYLQSRLMDWENAKTIISCRTDHLSEEKIPVLFATTIDGRDNISKFFITPFGTNEINEYLKKIIRYNLDNNKPLPWKTFEEYRKQIDSIDGLFKTITNPFMLFVTVDVLPDIVSSRVKKLAEKPDQKLELLKIELIEKYITRWFNREASRLRQYGRIQGMQGRTIIMDFKRYCEDLAVKMDKNNKLTEVSYTSHSDKEKSEWDEFFGPDDKVSLHREGALIRKTHEVYDEETLTTETKWAFIHKEIQDHFLSIAKQRENKSANEEKKSK